MRMWKVHPGLMCTQHLLGEHLEMHMFVGTLNKDKKLTGYIAKGLVETGRIRSRHDELVEEMTLRGMHHKSPLPEVTSEIGKYQTSKNFGYVDTVANTKELASRCDNCKQRQAGMREVVAAL